MFLCWFPELYELWKTSRYKSYPPALLIYLVARILALVPPWTRVYRVQRLDSPLMCSQQGVWLWCGVCKWKPTARWLCGWKPTQCGVVCGWKPTALVGCGWCVVCWWKPTSPSVESLCLLANGLYNYIAHGLFPKMEIIACSDLRIEHTI